MVSRSLSKAFISVFRRRVMASGVAAFNIIPDRNYTPGKPDQNAYVERFNRSFRQEVLDAYLSGSIAEAQDLSDEWLTDYTENRPHDGLGGLPPAHFLPRGPKLEKSSYGVCA